MPLFVVHPLFIASGWQPLLWPTDEPGPSPPLDHHQPYHDDGVYDVFI